MYVQSLLSFFFFHYFRERLKLIYHGEQIFPLRWVHHLPNGACFLIKITVAEAECYSTDDDDAYAESDEIDCPEL